MGLRSPTGHDAAAGGSEDMFHYPLDSLLRGTLAVIGLSIGTDLPLEMDRNRTDGYVLHFFVRDGFLPYIFYWARGTTSRPDFLLWLNGLLIFWGEETASSGAKEDLEAKFQMIDPLVFRTVNFMICYAANGPKIRFYAIDGSSKQPTPLVPLTHEINIT